MELQQWGGRGLGQLGDGQVEIFLSLCSQSLSKGVSTGAILGVDLLSASHFRLLLLQLICFLYCITNNILLYLWLFLLHLLTFLLEVRFIHHYYHIVNSNYNYIFTITSETYATFCVFIMLISII